MQSLNELTKNSHTNNSYTIDTFVFDMDGTLLNNHHELSPLTIRTLTAMRERGKHLIIATGRHFNDIQGYIRQLGGDVAAITCNGAMVHDRHGDLIYRAGLPLIINEAIIPLATQFNVHINLYTDSEWLVMAPCPELLEAHENAHFFYRQISMEELITTPALKILFYGENAELQALKVEIYKHCPQEMNLTFSDDCYLEVMQKTISKGHSLNFLLEKLSRSAASAMAFGDGMNDVELFRTVGHPIVMENAGSTLKQLFPDAPRAQNNHADGVANYLIAQGF